MANIASYLPEVILRVWSSVTKATISFISLGLFEKLLFDEL